MVEVASEAILQIEYDAASRVLFVRFTDGDCYGYFDVPPALHCAFIEAESHGRFFHENVRDRFSYRKVR